MNSITCTKCGLVAFATTTGCKRCGAPYAAAGAGGFTQTFGGKSAAGVVGQQASDDVYYRPSGEVTVAGLASGLGGGLVAAVALGFVYAYLITYLPVIFLNILCVIGYALVLGASAGSLLKLGKMRNPAVGMCIALIVTLVSYYFSWAVWLSIVVSGDEFRVSSWTLASHPLGLWGILQLVNEKGAWSIGHGYGSSKNQPTVSGVLLSVFWAAEALTVLIGSMVTAWGALTTAPFCEPCQVWCEEEEDVLSIRAAESDELKRRFEAKDFLYLKTVGPKGAGDAEWCRVDLHCCPGCGRTNTVRVNRQKRTVDRKGKPTVTSSNVFHGLLLTEADVRQLREIGSELTRPQSVAA